MVEHFPMDELHSFTLCRDDWRVITESLWEAAADRMNRSEAVGRDSTYGAILCDEAQRVLSVARYLELHLPDDDD